MVKRSIAVVAIAIVLGFVATCGPNRMDSSVRTFTSSWQSLPAPASIAYESLNPPRATMTLPAVFVGAQRQPASGCFLSIASSGEIPVAGELAVTVQREKEFEAKFKAEFSKALVDAGLSASAVTVLIERWETRLTGLTMVEVDPSRVRADFDNEACAAVSLDWFTDERSVAIAAIKAESLIVDMGSLADEDQRKSITLAVQNVGAEVGLSLARSALLDETLTYAAENVFVGVTTTVLAARRCRGDIRVSLEVDELARFSGCDGDVRITLVRRSTSYQVEVAVPSDGITTNPFDVRANGVFRRPLGNIRMTMGNLEVDRPSASPADVVLNVSVLEVALSGGGIPDIR